MKTKEKLLNEIQNLRKENEQLKTEKRSQEDQRIIDHLFNLSSPLCLINSNLNIVQVNDSFCKTFNVKKEDILNQKCYTILHHDFCNTKKCLMKQLSSNQGAATARIKRSMSNKDERIFTVKAEQYFKADGEFLGIVENFIDITESVKLKMELQESEDRFKFLTNATFEGIVVHKRGVVLDCNESFLQLFGYERDEVIGQNMLDYIPSMNGKITIMKNIVKNVAKPYFVEVQNKKGKKFLAELQAKNVRHNRKTVRIVAVRDVTEKVNAHKSLQESEERFKLTLQGADLGLWDWNIKTGKVLFDERWLEILDYSQDDLGDDLQTWRDLVHPDDLPEVLKTLDKHLNGQTELYESEYRMQTKSGKWKWILDRGKVLEKDSKGNPIRALGTHLDITPRKKAEQKIQNLLNEKEILLREVHHRIKNNMATIESLLRLHTKQIENVEAISALEDANGRVRSMRILYDKLFRTDNFSYVDMNEYLAPLIDEVISIFPEKERVKVTKNIAGFPINAKLVFPLGIIINEVITNVMKYAYEGISQPQLDVTVTKHKDEAEITIEDNGVGIVPDILDSKQSGFGLKLIEMLIRQIKGKAKIESENGVKFILSFKLRKNES